MFGGEALGEREDLVEADRLLASGGVAKSGEHPDAPAAIAE